MHLSKFNEIYKGVSIDLLQNCFLTDRLDKLVHKKFKHRPSYYYKDFCDNKLNTKTMYGKEENIDEMEILSGGHCPRCETKGYHTQNNRTGLIDCSRCFKLMCKFCCSGDNEIVQKM